MGAVCVCGVLCFLPVSIAVAGCLCAFVYVPIGNTCPVSPLAQPGTRSLASVRLEATANPASHSCALGCSCWTWAIQGTVKTGSGGCMSSRALGNEWFLWINFACPSGPVCTYSLCTGRSVPENSFTALKRVSEMLSACKSPTLLQCWTMHAGSTVTYAEPFLDSFSCLIQLAPG